MSYMPTMRLELIDGRRTTADGYQVVHARVARTGTQLYKGSEVGLMDTPSVVVWRPEEEVMDKASMATFAHKPITDNHPPELVTADNWRKYARGVTGESIARDGEFIVIPLGLMDAETIAQIDAGKRELSAGYACDLEFVDGVTPDGDKYNVIQRNIRINHVAVVQKGRAGSACRIGDTEPKPNEEKRMNMQQVQFDGLTIETTNQGAQVINTLRNRLADAEAAATEKDAAHASAIATKDAELGAKDAEIAKLKGAALTPEMMDAAVAARSEVLAKAKTFGDVETAGKTDAEIRRAAVALKLGDAAVADKSDDYVSALFDHMAADADPVKDALSKPAAGKTVRNVNTGDERTDAYSDYIASLNPKKEG